MSKTTIQAELPPELVSQAHDFLAHSSLKDINGLVEAALRDFFGHHARRSEETHTIVERQGTLQALRARQESCAKSGWDGHGAEPVSPQARDRAQLFLNSLPAGCPMPEIGAEPDGHLTLEWYRTPSRVLSVSVGPEGELNYAALVGDTSRRTGSEIFQNAVPGDLLHLIQQVCAA